MSVNIDHVTCQNIPEDRIFQLFSLSTSKPCYGSKSITKIMINSCSLISTWPVSYLVMKSKTLQILCQQIHGIFASVPQRLHHFWFYVVRLTTLDNCLKFGSWQVRNKLAVTKTFVVASIGKDPWCVHQECLQNNKKEFPTTYSFQKCEVIKKSKHYKCTILLLLPSQPVLPFLFIVALQMSKKCSVTNKTLNISKAIRQTWTHWSSKW